MLEVVYSLTKQDLWESHRHETKKAFLRAPVLHAVSWAGGFAFWWLILAGLYHILERDFLLCLALSSLQCVFAIPVLIFTRRKTYFKAISKTPDLLGERVIRVGKYDLFWGSFDTAGYHYHLSTLSEIVETQTCFSLVVQKKTTLIIPKSAFANREESQAFSQEVHALWEAAKHRQRYQEQETEEAWPPAPRFGPQTL